VASYETNADSRYIVRYYFAPDDHFDLPLEGDDLAAARIDKTRRDTERGDRQGTIQVDDPDGEGVTSYNLNQVRYWRILRNPERGTPKQRRADAVEAARTDFERRYREGVTNAARSGR
jgi:hypothetical protein